MVFASQTQVAMREGGGAGRVPDKLETLVPGGRELKKPCQQGHGTGPHIECTQEPSCC